jgi:Spx/MgsR family transcriptional regulator
MYGIANCDTIKKAKAWLENNHIEFEFHDYKKQSVSADFLREMINEHGLDTVVNKRGTTFRKLSEQEKSGLNEDTAIALLEAQPSMIKRPILVHSNGSSIGFKPEQYAEIFDLA